MHGARTGWFQRLRFVLWVRQSLLNLIASRKQIYCPGFQKSCDECRARISTSCRLRTPGSQAP